MERDMMEAEIEVVDILRRLRCETPIFGEV